MIERENARRSERLERLASRIETAGTRKIDTQAKRLEKAGQLLEAFSYQGVLKRGFAVVSDDNGKLVRSKDAVSSGEGVTLTFADGALCARTAVKDRIMNSFFQGQGEAKLHFGDSDFTIMESGAYVKCAVTNEHIPIERLKYWNADLKKCR